MTPCGSSSVYCPDLSVAPVPVTSGYYTTPLDGDETLRTGQDLCPLGHYCVDGLIFPCPAGTFGANVGLASAECSGKCKMGTFAIVEFTLPCTSSTSFCCLLCVCAGHYCPEASTSATEQPCPIGTYGDEEGLTDANCSGLCKTNNYCPRGTVNQFSRPV